MRILFVHPMWYFIGNYHRERRIQGAGYEENHRRLMDTRPGASDAYVHNLKQLGHDAAMVVYGCKPLQSEWAEENGLKIPLQDRKALRLRLRCRIIPWLEFVDNDQWHRLVLAAQVAAFKPDIIFTYTVFILPVEWLRSIANGAKLIAWIGTERVPDLPTLKGYDLILTLAPKYVPMMRSAGVRAEYLPAGFDGRVLTRVPATAVRDIPVSFVGSYGRGWGRGLDDTEVVAHETGMLCYGNSAHELPNGSAIRKQYRGECWGINMYRVLARSKVAFNRHADVPLDAKGVLHDPAQVVRFDEAGNMRLYEATGMGTLLVTDHLQNLDTLFEPDKEVVTYGTAEEAVEKIRYYLRHDKEREAIARAGQARTLREHTYKHRAQQLVDIIGCYL
ncbi:MAG: glycosyltransferase [Nitrospirae bacterium]|nr:glycosyltransferase [Nitrospirota bacterium]